MGLAGVLRLSSNPTYHCLTWGLLFPSELGWELGAVVAHLICSAYRPAVAVTGNSKTIPCFVLLCLCVWLLLLLDGFDLNP